MAGTICLGEIELLLEGGGAPQNRLGNSLKGVEFSRMRVGLLLGVELSRVKVRVLWERELAHFERGGMSIIDGDVL